MLTTKSSGVSIAYSVEGDGDETVLLIMGLGARAADWGRRFPQRLAERFRVVRFDNRGAGASEVPRDVWTLDDMARDAVAVLDAVGAERAHVVGLSMGGMISQLLALDHAARVDRLVLMATHFGGPGIVKPHPEVFSIFMPEPGTSPEQMVEQATRAISGPGWADAHPDAVAELVALAREQPTPKRSFGAQLQAILGSDRSERVRDIRAPTLVIHGDADPLIPHGNGMLLRDRIPGAQLETLPGVGHLVHYEAPEAVDRLVGDFLGRGASM